jgi:hypothetical protein
MTALQIAALIIDEAKISTFEQPLWKQVHSKRRRSMVVIVSVGKLHNGKIQLSVAKPQHSSKPVQRYASEKEAREVLVGLGVADEAADFYLFKLVPQLSGNQELTFPPMDIPQHVLLSRGFKL